MASDYYNKFHEKAIEDNRVMGESHNRWAHDLLKRLYEYWQEPDTPLPDIDFFDEVGRVINFKEKKMRKGSVPKSMWILIDRSNGDCGENLGKYGGRNYLFWFYSREAARIHKKEHDSDPHLTNLDGPYRYCLDPKAR